MRHLFPFHSDENHLHIPIAEIGTVASLIVSPAYAQPPRAQLAVEINYTRTVKLKSRLGPDNYEHTDSRFVLKARFETLADTVSPEEFYTWPHYT